MDPNRIGTHLLIDFFDVDAATLRDADGLDRALRNAAATGGMTPLGPPRLHRFDGGGLTGYLLLAESHIAAHTYPERAYAALDVFSCGRADALAALDALRKALRPGRERLTFAARGEVIPESPDQLGVGATG